MGVGFVMPYTVLQRSGGERTPTLHRIREDVVHGSHPLHRRGTRAGRGRKSALPRKLYPLRTRQFLTPLSRPARDYSWMVALNRLIGDEARDYSRLIDVSCPEHNSVAMYNLSMLERWRTPAAMAGASAALSLEQLVDQGRPRPSTRGIFAIFAFEYQFDVQDSSYSSLENLRDEQLRENARNIRDGDELGREY